MAAIRASIPAPERDQAATRIGETLIMMVRDAGTVMAFLSFGSELPTDQIVQALHDGGHQMALPHVEGKAVVPVAYAPGDPLEHAAFGIREPAKMEPIDPASIDVVLVPGLAFDARGFRIGYGGGFYDRLLPQMRPDTRRIGICFDAQVVDDVPTEEFDLPVHIIVTEQRTIQIADA